MKLLVVFTAFVALCAGDSNTTFPGDNSQYVEGESRYIWMLDDDGKQIQVDLQEPVDYELIKSHNGADNQYLLYTRFDPNNPQIIVDGDANTIWSSNYNANHSIEVIVHGWMGNRNTEMNPLITSAFLAVQDTNVIVVDWSAVARFNYVTAVCAVPNVGRYLGNFLSWLINTAGGNWNKVHLVGHSLGAHVVGNAGRTASNLPIRVTGLDPAGPLWVGNHNALNWNDGQYVEAIHTDGGGLGILYPIANVDFYVNGGMNPQPGCLVDTCSHRRSTELFASTVRFNHLVGRQCNDACQAVICKCNGKTLDMGNSVLNKTGNGIYCLSTGDRWPF